MKAMVKIEMLGRVMHSVCDMENAENYTTVMKKLATECGQEIVTEYWEAGRVPFDKLPDEVNEKALSTLKAYNEVGVVYEYGEFHVSAGCSIKANYNWDHCVCGYYKAEELYTKEERRQNFYESFGYYPAYMR